MGKIGLFPFGENEEWLVPHCYAAKLAEPLMGIKLNGTFSGNSGFTLTVLISISLSVFLFAVLSFVDAKDFSKSIWCWIRNIKS